ncbi:MAG: tellurite resistance TerB family protein [Pseudomonadota bacterium]
MSLFSRLRRQQRPDTELQRSVLTPAVLTMVVDGSIDPREAQLMISMVMTSPIFEGSNQEALEALTREIFEEVKRLGTADVIRRTTHALSPGLRETALCFAVRIAMADGVLADEELGALEEMCQMMGVDREVMLSFFQTIAALQRGPEG